MGDLTIVRDNRVDERRDVGRARHVSTSIDKSGRTACSIVLDIVELLEAILIPVDTKTMLLAQAVNRRFKDTIRGSIHLQRALFLLPAAEDGHRFGSNGINPLIMPLFTIVERSLPEPRSHVWMEMVCEQVSGEEVAKV